MSDDGIGPPTDVERWMVDGYPRAVAVVAAICGDVDIAEDCVAEAIVRTLDRDRGGIRSLDGWIIRIAVNRSRSLARRAAVARRHAERDLGVDRVAFADPTDGEEVLAAVRSLPGRQRETIVLHYYLGWSVQEIADALDRSTGGVKNALHKGRGRLAHLLVDSAPTDRPTFEGEAAT